MLYFVCIHHSFSSSSDLLLSAATSAAANSFLTGSAVLLLSIMAFLSLITQWHHFLRLWSCLISYRTMVPDSAVLLDLSPDLTSCALVPILWVLRMASCFSELSYNQWSLSWCHVTDSIRFHLWSTMMNEEQLWSDLTNKHSLKSSKVVTATCCKLENDCKKKTNALIAICSNRKNTFAIFSLSVSS